MRNLRKILAVVVVVTMLAVASMVPAFADTGLSASTQTCANLGMLLGTGNGVTADYAASTPTRIQAAVLFLRLKGLEADAKAFAPTSNFADADKASWAAPIMGYLKANPALGWVGDGTNFNPNDAITAQQYYKVVLTALGYAQDTDFAYADTLTFAQNTAKLAMAGNVDKFTIDAVAAATVEALGATVKGGTDNLATTLVKAGKLDADKATAAGLYAAAPAALEATVAATGAKILTVTFNQAVDTTKAAFAVAKGSFAVNVASTAFDAAKKVATITLATKLTAGDYTVTVSGLTTTALTAKVTATDETVSKIDILSTTVGLDRTVASNKQLIVNYKVTNQYGEDMTTAATSLVATASKGVAIVQSAVPNIVINNVGLVGGRTDTAYAAGDTLSLSIIDPGSGKSTSALLTVGNMGQVADITVSGLWDETDSATAANAVIGDGDTYSILISAKDQYGNDVAVGNLDNDILTTTSNSSLVTINQVGGVDQYATESVNGTNTSALKINTNVGTTGGTATITLISKTTGHMAKFDVVLKDAQKASSIQLTAPSIAVAGEEFDIPMTVLDQDGNAITDYKKLLAGGAPGNAYAYGGVTLSVTGITGPTGANIDALSNNQSSNAVFFTEDYVKNTPRLVVNAKDLNITDPQNVVVTAVTPNGKIAQVSISLQPNARPTVITGITGISTSFAIYGQSQAYINTANANNVSCVDQYGRSFDLTGNLTGVAATPVLGAGNGQYRVNFDTSDGTKVLMNGGTADVQVGGPGDSVILKGIAKGTSTLTLKLQKTDGATWTDVANSDYSLVSKVVDIPDIVSYKLASVNTLYDGGYALTGTPTAPNDYTQNVEVDGVLADGTTVVVPRLNLTSMATPVTNYFFSDAGNTTIHYDAVTGHVYAIDAAADYTVSGNVNDTRTATVNVIVNGNDGVSVLPLALTISHVAPAVSTFALQDCAVADGAPLAITKQSDNAISVAIGAGVGITQANLNSIASHALKVTDQYGISDTLADMIVAGNAAFAGGNATETNITNSHTIATMVAGDTFNMTVVTGNGKVFTMKVILTQ